MFSREELQHIRDKAHELANTEFTTPDEWMGKHLVRVAAKKVRPKTGHYSKIIRVFAPCDFYWTKDGKFDGCDFDVSECRVTRHQERLIHNVLDAVGEAMEADGISPTDVPDAIKDKTVRARVAE